MTSSTSRASLSLSAIIAVSMLSIASPSPLQNSNPLLSSSSTLSIQQQHEHHPASTTNNSNNPLQLQYHHRPSTSKHSKQQQQQQPPPQQPAIDVDVVVRYYATWNPTSPCSPKSSTSFDAWEESYTSLMDCCEEKFGWDLDTCLSPSSL